MDQKDYRLAAVMFTDIVGFSRMMEKDEAGTLKIMEFHNDLVKKQVQAFTGKIIKTIGDAFLVEFPTANNAVKCAIEIQRDLETHNNTEPKTRLILRIGVHLGDIHFSDTDALGEGINIASRLQSLCRPGRVCISGEVHNLVSNKIEVPIQALGAVTLKNISRPLSAYEIMTNGGAEPIVAESAPALVPEDKAPAPSPSPQLSQSASEADEVTQLRAIVFQQIKQAGRRLSVTEMRGLLPPQNQGPLADALLEKLADGGFLFRLQPQGPGNPEVEPRRPSDRPHFDPDDNDEEDWRQKYSHHYERFRERVEEVERQRGQRDYRRDFRPGRVIAQQIKSEVMNAVHDSIQANISRKPVTFDQYVGNLDRKMAKEKEGWLGHLRSYIGVNALLWGIGIFTGSIVFPWPLIVTLAWGIGIASHWTSYRDKRREASQLKSLPSLDQKQFGLVRKLFKERRGWNGHLVSNVAVGFFLAALSLITSPLWFWAIFPIAGMAIGLFAHLPSFKAKEQDLLGQLASEGVPIDALSTHRTIKEVQQIRATGTVGPIASEAEKIRLRIINQVKNLKGPNPLGDDFDTVLENYVQQIKELAVRDRDIDNIISTIPVRDLDKELASTQAEMEQTTEPRMRVEYEKAIEQIGKQKKAYGEMVSEQKVLKLRLNNALNSLKQLEIDLARMSSLTSGQTMDASGPSIREKSGELDKYLTDLRSGYQEIDALEKGFFGLEAELAKGAVPTEKQEKNTEQSQ